MLVEKADLMQNSAYWQFFRDGKEIGVRFGINPVSDAIADVEFIGPSVEARKRDLGFDHRVQSPH